MNRTTWIIIGLLCVAGITGLVMFTKKETVNLDDTDPTSIIESKGDTIGDNVFGKKDSKVKVFEYADFQCAGCSGAHRNTPRIMETYKDKVAFVFRNFPLTSIHPNALAASTAAEAAGLQGKYWEMNDLLFTNSDQWTSLSAEKRNDKFVEFANQINLNIDKFNSDLSSVNIQNKIQVDRALGNKVGVKGTPSFYIGSTKADSATVDDVIQKDGKKLMDMIDKALKDAGETPPTRL